MIHSMTGFGKAIFQNDNKKISLEVKSLNSKNIDLNSRIPSKYREKELYLRNKIAKRLLRGKVDFGLYIEVTNEEAKSTINTSVVKTYMGQLSGFSGTTPSELLRIAMSLPDVLKVDRENLDEEEFIEIDKLLDQVLDAVQEYRSSEGMALEKDFRQRIDTIGSLLDHIIEIDPERITNVRTRLQKGIEELKDRVDENRFEQELIYYIEKFDITEEKVRLKNHLSYFLENLDSPSSNGKKLGFITQEIGREINTIGSKSNFAPMQKLVVQMKDELEKIKEQLLNVL